MATSFDRVVRRRLTPFAIAVGVVGSAVLGLGVTGTFSALTATIINSTNTAGTGSIVMQETDSSGTVGTACASSAGSNNSYTCTTFNKYGGSTNMTPGGAAANTTIRIYSTGSMTPSSFTLLPGACTVTNPLSTSGNICDSFKVTLTCTPYSSGTAGTPVTVYTAQTLTQINTTGLKTLTGCVPATSTVGSTTYSKLDFSLALDSAAGNTVQGQSVSQPLTWQFSS